MRCKNITLGLAAGCLMFCGAGLAASRDDSGVAADPQIALGQPAPQIQTTDANGKAVHLDDFNGKPVVLELGSITEPIFRLHAAALDKLAGDYADRVNFLIVYGAESHAADSPQKLDLNEKDGASIAAPKSEEERRAAAKQCADKLALTHETMLVDSWDNSTEHRLGNLPNETLLLDRKGTIVAIYPWCDPIKLRGAIDDLLAAKEIAAEHQGIMRPVGPVLEDPDNLNDKTGKRRGPLAVVIVIDNLQLNDRQKEAVYPALADFVAQARDIKKEAKKDGSEDKLESLRTAAQKLKTVMKDSLSSNQYQQVMDALGDSPARRLFTDN